MRTVKLTVELQVTDNANNYDVRLAASRCLAEALHIYAESTEPRPHRITGAPVHTFGSAVAKVSVS
jgi:hypothetical protein